MSGSYADNAYNRSVGRAGMPMGSMVISSGSSGSGGGFGASSGGYSGGYSGSSSGYSTSKTYVDNSSNRRLGRVGMEHGTAVASRSSASAASSSGCSSAKTYVDNSSNRRLGRVGMEHGTAVASRSSAKEFSHNQNPFRNRPFDENSMQEVIDWSNKMFISPPSSGTGATPKTYVDNPYNRRHGRVGLEHGTAVISKFAPSAAKSRLSSAPPPGPDTSEKGTAKVSKSASNSNSSMGVYKDNDFNRRIGRVGLPVGSMKVSRPAKSSTSKPCNTSLRWQPPHGPQSRYIDDHRQQTKEEMEQQVADVINRMQQVRLWQEKSRTKSQPSTSQALIESRQASSQSPMSKTLPWSRQDKSVNAPRSLVQSYPGIKIDYDELDLKAAIGHGGFGVVHFAEWKGTVVAVKKLRVQRVSRKRLENFISEIRIFCTLDHPNIVKFLGACVVTPNLAIVMEYMEESLFQKIHVDVDVEDDPIPEEWKLSIMTQVVSGLEYLHSKHIAHCDIKSHNVLLSSNETGGYIAKITDFGLSMMKSDAETSTTKSSKVQFAGTPRYSAPEVLRGDILDRTAMMRADIYSLGLVLYEVICEEEPFSDLNQWQLERHVGDGDCIPEIGTDVNYCIADTVEQCWARDPRKRPSAAGLLDVMYDWDILYERGE